MIVDGISSGPQIRQHQDWSPLIQVTTDRMIDFPAPIHGETKLLIPPGSCTHQNVPD